eukprot:345247_1
MMGSVRRVFGACLLISITLLLSADWILWFTIDIVDESDNNSDIANHIHLIKHETYFHVIKAAASDNKTKILITGIGHSATSYVQQFIGDVLFNKQNVFYLFEATHGATREYLWSHYNDSIYNHDYDIPIGAKILSVLYQCDFKSNIDYSRGLFHYKLITSMNTWNHESTSVNGEMLTQKCLSAKYLIYKEIQLNEHSSFLLFLWNQFPRLKVIAMVRNPMSHIPSFRRMPKFMPSLNQTIWKICDKQWKDIQFGLNTNVQYQVQRFHVFKLEEFFDNITYKLNDSDTVKYYYQNILSIKWNATETSTLNVAHKYNEMQHNLWWPNRKQPLNKTQQLHPKDKQYITESCSAFNRFFGYEHE